MDKISEHVSKKHAIVTVTNLEEEFVNIKYISGLRDPEAKLRLLDNIKAKTALSVAEMTDCTVQKSNNSFCKLFIA